MTRLAVLRILDTRRRRERLAWIARAACIEHQLRALRATAP